MEALRAFEVEQAKAYRENLDRWRDEHALWKGARDYILAKAKRGKADRRAAAQADLEALGPEPAAPPSTERTVTEPTFEGLTRLFAQGQPSLGIFSDEGGQFLGGFAMSSDNRQKTLAALNDLWQGNPIRRTRQGDGSTTLFGRRLAVHLMVQPGVARAFMADPAASDTGFLPRFLISEPPSTIGNRLHAYMRRNDTALADFSGRMSEILETPMPADPVTRALEMPTIRLSHDARTLLVAFSDVIERQQAAGGDLAQVTGYASKAAEQAARIAGVLTLFDDLCAAEVTAELMGWGIELAQFYLGEAARLADAATVSLEVERAETLRRWIVGTYTETEITMRDVMRLAPTRALRDRLAAKKAIAMLVEAGWLVALEAGTMVRGKPRREAWHIVRDDDVV